jgi:hypothetical protein
MTIGIKVLARTIAMKRRRKIEYSILLTHFDSETNKVPPEDSET